MVPVEFHCVCKDEIAFRVEGGSFGSWDVAGTCTSLAVPE